MDGLIDATAAVWRLEHHDAIWAADHSLTVDGERTGHELRYSPGHPHALPMRLIDNGVLLLRGHVYSKSCAGHQRTRR
jgi:hypothetical protein